MQADSLSEIFVVIFLQGTATSVMPTDNNVRVAVAACRLFQKVHYTASLW
jgi:hypothetical protein